MKVKGIDHVSINTKDMKASADFYGGVLGWKRMELFDYGGKNPRTAREESEVGLRHLAFSVENVDEEEGRLRSAGVSITLPATDLPSLGARVLLFLDPNGVVLEFCERLVASEGCRRGP